VRGPPAAFGDSRFLRIGWVEYLEPQSKSRENVILFQATQNIVGGCATRLYLRYWRYVSVYIIRYGQAFQVISGQFILREFLMPTGATACARDMPWG
jgi:hypothetical protein